MDGMEFELRYLYDQGEELRYLTVTHLMVADPDAAAPDGTQEAEGERSHGSIIFVMKSNEEKYALALTAGMIDGSGIHQCGYAHDWRGQVLSEPDPEEFPGYQRPFLFPEGTVKPGDSWEQPDGLILTLNDVVTHENGEIEALLSSDLRKDLGGGINMSGELNARFSILRGRLLEIDTDIWMSRGEGRVVHTTTVTLLQE